MNPKDHPNAFVGLSSGTVAAFLVAEAKRRLGWDLSLDEASMIVAGVISAALFAGRKLSGKKADASA